MKEKGERRRGIIRGKAMLGIMLATLLLASILAALFGLDPQEHTAMVVHTISSERTQPRFRP